jgi:hypothetical protein
MHASDGLDAHSVGRFFVTRSSPHSLSKREESLGLVDAAVASE